ncbi:phospholipid-transporting ATPase ABCA3-like [Ixodes scapularis]
MYWTFSCVIPFLILDNAGGHGYHFIARGHKLWTCIFPGMNLHWGFRVLNRFEKFVDSGANWSNFYDPKETPDNVTLFEIATVGFLSDVLIIVLVWYLDNVLPIGPGISKPVGYPFMKSYWFPGMTSVKAVDKTDEEKLNFETEPKNQVVAIELLQVNKNYKDTVAVSNCNMRVFEGQITVLLGHNGAGKTTTLNMITGYIGATSGTILVGGYDILNATRDARKSVGYCAQHNIFYRDLTVEEHLLFFAAVKGAPRDRLRFELVTLLGEVGLMEVRNTLAGLLSPGFQRRLCTALAIIATPKLVVLDEPTANMDPDARREMWELLLKVRRQSAVLITTQHMDEADVLGDRIAIMANGRIRCMGSPAFLKQRFGTGYHMQVNKAAFCNVSAIESLLRKYAPRAHLQSDSDNEAVFVLGQIGTTRHTIAMFRDLEQGKDKLGIESLGLTVTTLEDVLMRVGEEHHFRRHHMHSDFDDENEFIEARESVVNVMADNISSEPGLVQRIRALLAKRAICTWRQWRLPLFSWLLPPLLLFSLFYLEEVTLRGSGHAKGGRGDELYYRFHDVLGSGKHETQSAFVEKYLGPVLVEQSFKTDDIPADYNIAQYLLGIAQHSLRHYIFDIHAGFQMTKQKGTLLWYNGEGPHAGLLALSAFNTARLRNLTQNPTATMVFSVKAHPSVKRDENELVKQQNTYREVMPKVLRSIFFPMVSSLMCSNFVIYPVIERVTQVKHLHFMNGVSSLLYWSANFFWDFMFYLGTALFVLPPLLSQLDYLVGIDTQAIILLNLLHGFAVLPGIYIASFFFDNPIQGYSTLAITAFILSFLGCLGTVFVEHFAYTINAPLIMVALEVMLQAMLLVPSFSYSRGMTKILELSSENKICRTGGVNLERVCHTHAVDFKLSLKLCCEVPKGQRPEDATIQALSVHPYSAFYEATTLAVEGLVLFLVLMFVESRWAYRIERLLSTPQENVRATATPRLIASPTKVMLEDSDAARENALVDTLSASTGRDARPFGPDQRPAMVVSRLMKAYGWWQKKPVLQGLSFVLRTGECFGLLGVNGAGKTTTFRILTGDVLPADGDVFLDGFSIVRQTRLVQAHLGYCPQRDGLVDELTGTETLILHSRLKGVANDADYLEVLFEIFDLADIAGNLVGTYSVGNKRKLSLCLAMVGMPRVLLLDEPYAGIGTTARKRVINYITALQRTAKMSIVLTSHSLTDVEFLCNRIAILGSGKLQCLGSLPHLKQKFGKGVTITVKTYPDKKQDFVYQKDVVTAVKMDFPKAQLAHSYEGLLEFRMTQVSMLWSEMFTLMGKIKRKFKLQDFFITDTSLEHIYRSFTRNETSMAAALAEVR